MKRRWERLPLLSSLEGWSHRLFGPIAPKILSTMFELKDNLQRAGLKIYPETYVSLMCFSAVLSLPVTIISLFLVYHFRWILLLLLVPTPTYVIIAFLITPSMKASNRAHNLEREMPFAAAYMTVMASGGISPYMSIKRLANIDIMPAMRKEAREVLRHTEIFGIDPLSALNKAAQTNPLDTFSGFFSGYASTVITGGDVTHFLEMKTEDIFKARSQRVKVAAERLGMLLESFIIVMVLMSLCFYILFTVESIYSVGISAYPGMILYTYVFAPLLSIVFIYLAHDIQPKTPITDWRPYKAFGICSLIAFLVFVLLTGFFGMIQVSFFDFLRDIVDLQTAVAITLVISTAAPAVIQGKISRKRLSTERGIAGFLRDLTEVRKTGLSPEKCIETLSVRDYGAFSDELKKIASEVSWGVALRRVLMDFVGRTKSWLSQVVVFLLVEAIDVGGGTIGMIESLTRFNIMTQEVEKERRMSVRPYILIPYFAAILLMSTTLMMLILLTKTISMAGTREINLDQISMTFVVSCIVHVYMIGLVAGKIGEESISAGFKHSALLVVISLLAAIFVPQMVTI